MLRWMYGKTGKNGIKNECICENLWVVLIGDKLRGTHLRWFRHVQHMPTTALVRKNFCMHVDGSSRKKGSGDVDMDGSRYN